MNRTLIAAGAAFAIGALAACGSGGGDEIGALSTDAAATSTTPSTAPVVATQIPTSQLPPGPPAGGSNTYTCLNVQVGPVLLDTVFVPDGATCALLGTRLTGTVQVGQGAFLDAVDVQVTGNVQSQGAGHVSVTGRSTVGGSIQLEQGLSATLVGVQVTGDIQFIGNRGALLAERNSAGANIQVRQNTGGVTLNSNLAIGNLECQANFPEPVGGGNVAALKTDQCEAL